MKECRDWLSGGIVAAPLERDFSDLEAMPSKEMFEPIDSTHGEEQIGSTK